MKQSYVSRSFALCQSLMTLHKDEKFTIDLLERRKRLRSFYVRQHLVDRLHRCGHVVGLGLSHRGDLSDEKGRQLLRLVRNRVEDVHINTSQVRSRKRIFNMPSLD